MLVLRPTIRHLCSLFKVRHVMGALIMIVVGLFTELLMRFSYYIHLRFGKSFRLTWESNPGLSARDMPTLPLDQGANFII